MKIGTGDGFNDVVIDFEDGDSNQLKRIMAMELREWAILFSEKNREYGGDAGLAGYSLGPAGEFVEINRKVAKLHRALWKKLPLTSESTEVVLRDIIGHCFMTLDMLRQGEGEDK